MARESSRKIEHWSAFPEFHDRGIVEILLGGALDEVIGFASGGGGGKRDAELIGEVEREAKILVHQAQWKAWDVLAFEQIRRFDIEHAGARHAGLQDFDKFFAGNAGAGREGEGFGEGVDLEREDQVHPELDGLASAMRAEVKPFL